MLLITEPSGARLPRGNVTVLVKPCSLRTARAHDHIIGTDAVLVEQAVAQTPCAARSFPTT